MYRISRKIIPWVGLLILIAFVVNGCKRDPVVATVGKAEIRASELEQYLIRRGRGEEGAAKMPLADRLASLEFLTSQKLKLLDAYDRKIDQRSDVAAVYADLILRGSQQELYNREVRDKVITESEVKEFWKHLDEELSASHILITVSKNAGEAEKKAAKQRADSVYKAATKPNADFAALARAVTQDMTARDGDIGTFRWGRMVDEFQTAAWDLRVNEISKPVLTSYGWHIIKVTARKKVERRPFDTMKDEIKRTLMAIKREPMMKQAQTILNDIAKEYSLKVDSNNIRMIMAKAGPSSSPEQRPFSTLSDADKEIALVTFKPGKEKWGMIVDKPYYKAGKVTVNALIEKFEAAGRPAPVNDYNSLRDMVNQIAQEWLLTDYAFKKGMNKSKEVVEKANKDLESTVIARAESEEVQDKVKHPTDAELMTYLQQNPGRFQTAMTSDLVEVLFTDGDAAQKFAAAARKRGKITDAEARKLTKRVAPKGKEGILEKVGPNNYGSIGTAAMRAQVGEVVGPIREGNNFSVFQVKKKNEPHVMTLEEGRDQIIGTYQMEKGEELRKAWVDRLKVKYPVKVLEDRVSGLFGGVKPATASDKPGTPPKPTPGVKGN